MTRSRKKLDDQILKGNTPAPAVRIIETADAPLLIRGIGG